MGTCLILFHMFKDLKLAVSICREYTHTPTAVSEVLSKRLPPRGIPACIRLYPKHVTGGVQTGVPWSRSMPSATRLVLLGKAKYNLACTATRYVCTSTSYTRIRDQWPSEGRGYQ